MGRPIKFKTLPKKNSLCKDMKSENYGVIMEKEIVDEKRYRFYGE